MEHMRTLNFTLLFSLSLTSGFCQTDNVSKTLKGKIMSANKQVMFATVGIVKENLGTITSESGEFELKIPTGLLNQMLTISHIGYNTLDLNLDSLLTLGDVEIELIEKVESLKEVTITAEKLKGKTKEYGNTKKHNSFVWIQKGDRGAEIVTLIDLKNEILLNSVSLNILNQLEKEFTLLLNIYGVDETTNLPGLQLLKNQKIIQSTLAKGWLEVDLTDEIIVLDEPFYVGFQWINMDEPLPYIGGKSSKSKNSLIRYKALGTWEEFVEWDIKAKGITYKAP